jgi:hypothetical protein
MSWSMRSITGGELSLALGTHGLEGCHAVWNPEEGERDAFSRRVSSIASQPLLPGQAVMRSLGPRDRQRGRSNRWGEGRFHLDLQALAMQAQAGVSLVPSVPVSPEDGIRTHRKRMEQDAHLAWFGCRAPAPLALLPQRTRATLANAGGINHPQTAINCSAAFMWTRTCTARHLSVPSG